MSEADNPLWSSTVTVVHRESRLTLAKLREAAEMVRNSPYRPPRYFKWELRAMGYEVD